MMHLERNHYDMQKAIKRLEDKRDLLLSVANSSIIDSINHVLAMWEYVDKDIIIILEKASDQP